MACITHLVSEWVVLRLISECWVGPDHANRAVLLCIHITYTLPPGPLESQAAGPTVQLHGICYSLYMYISLIYYNTMTCNGFLLAKYLGCLRARSVLNRRMARFCLNIGMCPRGIVHSRRISSNLQQTTSSTKLFKMCIQ
jgi:hypothetical protein